MERKRDTGLIQKVTWVSAAGLTVPYGTSQRDTVVSVEGAAGGAETLQSLVIAKPVPPIPAALNCLNCHLKQKLNISTTILSGLKGILQNLH